MVVVIRAGTGDHNRLVLLHCGDHLIDGHIGSQVDHLKAIGVSRALTMTCPCCECPPPLCGLQPCLSYPWVTHSGWHGNTHVDLGHS